MFVKITTTKNIQLNQMKSFKIEDKKIAVANIENKFFAIDDLCTHAKCSLSKGELSGEKITCPCHGAQFNIRTGEVLAMPATQNVKTYKIKQEGNDLLIEI